MCELQLRTFAVAGDHWRKIFSWEFRAHSDSKYSALDPAQLHVRSTAPWTRTRNSEKATFLLPVCTRNTYSALVGLFSIKTGCCLKKRQDTEDGGRGKERKQFDLHVHTRRESKDFSTTWLWQSVSAVPQHCLTTPLSHMVANVKQHSCFGKRVEIDKSDFVRRVRAPVPQAAVDVTPVTAWEHSETLLFRPETWDFSISRRVESHRPVEVKAVRNVVSDGRHKLPKPIRKTRLPEVRKCMCFDKCFNVHVSGTAFRTVCQRAAHFMPYCPNAMTFKTFVTSTQSWHCTCFSAYLLTGAKEPKILKQKKKKKMMHVY